MKVRVLHWYYGCDTGCCGHIVEVDDEEIDSSFEFIHFSGEDDPKLREFVLRHLPETCRETIDWATLELDTNWSC